MYHWYLIFERRRKLPHTSPACNGFVDDPGTSGFHHQDNDGNPYDRRIFFLGVIELIPILGGFLGIRELRPWWLGITVGVAGVVISGLIAFFTRHQVPAPPLYSSHEGHERQRSS